MKLHRFFVEEKIRDRKTLEIKEDRLIHQWRNVLRFAVGEKVILFDGQGDDFLCEIKALTKNDAKLTVLERTKGITPKKKVALLISLIKRESFELVLEKATELGVSHIIPVVAERSEKKSINHERAVKIIIEASEQSGRADVPILDKVAKLEDVVEKYKKELSLFVFDPTGSSDYVQVLGGNNIGLAIGPEGGFTKAELEFLSGKEIPIVKLGEQVLRAETASIVALALSLV
jgi:16S rRNA (uracil1498-N3)-methyltransferase